MFIWSPAEVDEIAAGHLIRLRILNGVRRTNAVHRALYAYLEQRRYFSLEQFHQDLPTLCYLAWASRGTYVDYLRKHSWLAYKTVTHSGSTYAYSETLNFRAFRYNHGLGPASTREYLFCPQCVREDLDVFGYSYWRRIHQFGSVFACAIHRKGLRTVKSPRLGLPHMHLREARGIDRDVVSSAINSAVACRYEEIAKGLLRCDRPIRAARGRIFFLRRCYDLGLMRPRNRAWSMAVLRQHIVRTCPPAWLAAHFSKHASVVDPRTGQFRYGSIRHRDWGPKRIPEYTISLAVLFDSAEEALGTFLEDQRK